jgi:hypothetical protein
MTSDEAHAAANAGDLLLRAVDLVDQALDAIDGIGDCRAAADRLDVIRAKLEQVASSLQ